jgi:hypothetical protein
MTKGIVYLSVLLLNEAIYEFRDGAVFADSLSAKFGNSLEINSILSGLMHQIVV